MPVVLAVASGGAAGALARFGVDSLMERHVDALFPWSTFAVNISGCFLNGLLVALVVDALGALPVGGARPDRRLPRRLHDVLDVRRRDLRADRAEPLGNCARKRRGKCSGRSRGRCPGPGARAARVTQPFASAWRRLNTAHMPRTKISPVAYQVGGADLHRLPREQPSTRLQHPRDRVPARDPVNPALEQLQRDVDRREEEDQEYRRLHDRPGLHRLEAHRDAARPEEERHVDQDGEQVHAGHVRDRSP